ncbi:hypothetical protein IKF33_00815 [Candidatus Saccharibacteria bacterium]|nr:hypothetical protein [Candidatus Saccharibacteria bacterium]
MKIAFVEDNPILKQAIADTNTEAVWAPDLEIACAKVTAGEAQALIAGIDFTSRDVILACRDHLGMTSETFSSSFVIKKADTTLIVADAATCKHPTEDQLYDIVMQTYQTATKIFDTPKIAILSFSTLGSGGHDDTMTMSQNVVKRIRAEHPDILIDGEMQLDAAVNPKVAAKKAPDSPVAGSANVLICPDLNSGNILYKSLEQFGGFTAAGPILQGFNYPASDLSRGSTVSDVIEVIHVLEQIKR